MTSTESVSLARRSDRELSEMLHALPATSAQRKAACEALVRRYDFLVRAAVRRYRDSPEPEEDLMQVGYVGLLKALNNFDPDRGVRLPAYAEPCITGEIKRYFRDKRWQLRVRRSAQELMLEVRQARATLTQELGRVPLASEIASAAGLSVEEVRTGEGAERAFRPEYLDAPLIAGEESTSLGELIGQEDPGIEHTLDMESVWAHWAELPRREQRILAMRFYGNMTQQEIAERIGISQMHVSRLLAGSLSRLRQRLTQAGGGDQIITGPGGDSGDGDVCSRPDR
jgi:RNA polymerase sigma-B factor